MAGVKYGVDHIDRLIQASVRHREISMREQHAQMTKQAEQQNALREAQIAASEHEGFCVKCKEKRTVVTADLVEHKNGMKSVVGECPDCGAPVHRFQKKETADAPA